jgi:hypothetical protein
VGPATLDPRLEGIGSGVPELPGQKPIARADDVTAGFGETVILDGSASEAAVGRSLMAYHWRLTNEGET